MRKSGGADEFVAEYAAEEWVWGGALLARPTSARQKPARWKRAGRRMSVWPSSCWVLRIGVLARISSTGIACAPGSARLNPRGGNVSSFDRSNLAGCESPLLSERRRFAASGRFAAGRPGGNRTLCPFRNAGPPSLAGLFQASRMPPQSQPLCMPPRL